MSILPFQCPTTGRASEGRGVYYEILKRRGAQGAHRNKKLCVVAPSGGPRDTAIGRRAQREKGATWIGSVAKWHLRPIASDNCAAALLHYGSTLPCILLAK